MPPADPKQTFLILVIHLFAVPNRPLGVEFVHHLLDKPAESIKAAKLAETPSLLEKGVARHTRATRDSGTHSRLARAAEDVAGVALSRGMHGGGQLPNELHLKLVDIRDLFGTLVGDEVLGSAAAVEEESNLPHQLGLKPEKYCRLEVRTDPKKKIFSFAINSPHIILIDMSERVKRPSISNISMLQEASTANVFIRFCLLQNFLQDNQAKVGTELNIFQSKAELHSGTGGHMIVRFAKATPHINKPALLSKAGLPTSRSSIALPSHRTAPYPRGVDESRTLPKGLSQFGETAHRRRGSTRFWSGRR